MSNNINVTEGTGKTVATEDLGGAQYQKIKVVGGQTGSTSVMGVNPDGSINVSIIGALALTGSVVAIPAGNQSVSGAVTAPPGSVATTVHPAGSVTAVTFSGATSVSGAVTAPPGSVMTVAALAGSVMAVSSSAPAGSIAAVTITSIATAGAVMGSVAALQGTNPWTTVRPAGSVTAIANLAGSITAVSGATTTTAGSVISSAAPAGSVMAVRTDNASVITTQIAGSIMAISGTFVTPAGSVQSVTNPAGSVTAVRTDNASVIAVFQNSSIISVPVGSTITVLQAASIVGTYAEDAPSASGDKGFLVMGARNDTLASVTSADGDYSSHVVGPSGELIIANSPITKWLAVQSSVMYGTSVQVMPAPGASIFNYLSSMQIANDSGTFSRIKVTGGLGSVLAWTVAPANGGSNIVFTNPIKTGENSGVSVSISGVSSVYVNMQGFTAKI